MCQTFLLQESEADPGWLNRREVYFKNIGNGRGKFKDSLGMMPKAWPQEKSAVAAAGQLSTSGNNLATVTLTEPVLRQSWMPTPTLVHECFWGGPPSSNCSFGCIGPANPWGVRPIRLKTLQTGILKCWQPGVKLNNVLYTCLASCPNFT